MLKLRDGWLVRGAPLGSRWDPSLPQTLVPRRTLPVSDWHLWTGFIAAAILARAVVSFGLLGAMPLVSDAEAYAQEALGLVREFPPNNAFYWPPGNPIVLAFSYAVLGHESTSARVVTLLAGTISAVVAALVAKRLFQDRRAAIATGFLAALYMPSVMLSAQPYSQHVAGLSLLLVAYWGLRAFSEGRLDLHAGAGFAYGLGCLTRPSMLSVLPVLALLAAKHVLDANDHARKPSRRAALGLAIFAVAAGTCIGSIMAHNHAHQAGMVISTNNERNFFLGNNPYTPNYKTSQFAQRAFADLDTEVQQYLKHFYQQPNPRDAMMSEALRFIRERPMITLYRTWNRATSFWGFDYLSSRLIQAHTRVDHVGLLGLLAVEAGSYLLVMALALIGLCCFAAQMSRIWLLWLLSLVLAYEVPYMTAFSGGTFHFPVMGLILPFAGGALAEILSRGGRSRVWARLRASRLVWCALAVLFLIQIEYAYQIIVMA
jgi:4-amino-4-deoxy-L-arabinose transferase-like glycosyltransferase